MQPGVSQAVALCTEIQYAVGKDSVMRVDRKRVLEETDKVLDHIDKAIDFWSVPQADCNRKYDWHRVDDANTLGAGWSIRVGKES